MITGTIKRDIDRLWTEFWTGGITNPLTVIEQITYLMFARLLDIQEAADERRSSRTGRPFRRRFSEKEQHIRWRNLRQIGDPQELLVIVRDEVFPHFKKLATAQADEIANERALANLMRDAQLMIVKPSLLAKAIEMVELLPLTEGDKKGDIYEYLLMKLTTAGINGQFRTPRHIIDLMVAIVDPKPTDRIADPSCGTGGFLVQTVEYLRKKYTSEDGILRETDPETGEELVTYTGDKLTPEEWNRIETEMFHGFDFDATMLRLAAMNMMLHGVNDAGIAYKDTLSSNYEERDAYDVILANPPFKGALDFEDIDRSLTRIVKTKKTELLFIGLILRMLKDGGRAAVIVPDGVLFGASTAHRDLRQKLLDENQLEAVISLPSGVFKPYAGVSTAIMVFTKGGRTDDVFYYDVEADGYSLDDKRDKIKADDLPDCLKAWTNRNSDRDTDRTQKAFLVSAQDIRDANYDLSLSRYRERVYEEEEYDKPTVILDRIVSLNTDIAKDLSDLKEMLT
ncbi:class I SAM-dependent DNA methyltransferase [Defluviimonas aestuarii]|uniref:type I restriction-modification system subunit M n=1 Tax=Albidovulum aestuarii TaxID=1130726 RepID=UPI00249C117D|nr:class I SAM-dependent DNA methyltransferase [Defluviimonas aestuarii]MDI3337940.1 class I SAM-dependent DNA methyltransferase [Defluviimonas aestuarii]